MVITYYLMYRAAGLRPNVSYALALGLVAYDLKSKL